MNEQEWSKDDLMECLDILIDSRLAWGTYRTVFPLRVDPANWVVKVEHKVGTFANVSEWETWARFKDYPKIARWLAPCRMISKSGKVLIQRRTTPVAIERLPPRIPHFLADRKVQNYGMLDHRVVCHDYAFIHYAPSTQMGKANWWDETK